MRKIGVIVLIASLVIAGLQTYSYAKLVTMIEAQVVAEHWIALIIAKKGSWGGEGSASAEDIKELKRKGRTVGYFCKVHPKGYIILSLRKEFVPVKAYSAVSDLDPEKETGMADLIKGSMEKIVDKVEKELGRIDSIPSDALKNVLHKNYLDAWEFLKEGREETPSGMSTQDMTTANYQEGDFLIQSDWHQNAPYNNFTPGPCSNGNNTKVGCVATAGAQIMRYWNWPPSGTNVNLPNWPQFEIADPYDWPNILDEVTTGDAEIYQDAVAELCHEVGQAVRMNYGCDVSLADTDFMKVVFNYHFRYSSAVDVESWPYYTSAASWFNLLKAQLNLNRPILYNIPGDPGHAVVLDGWQEITEFNPVLMQYHMNYGWANSATAWYTLGDEGSVNVGSSMVRNVYPEQSLGSTLSGTYATNDLFPYRYFDQDATGSSATFQSGQLLQFLEGITVTNTSTSGGTFTFEGDAFGSTVLYTGGNVSKGIKIDNGELVLNRNGSIRFE